MVSRQHGHWGETSLASWLRTSVITIGAAKAAGKQLGARTRAALVGVAFLNMLLATAAFWVRAGCRLRECGGTEEMWVHVQEGESVVLVLDGLMVAGYLVVFGCLVFSYGITD